MDKLCENVKERILERMDFSRELPDLELKEMIAKEMSHTKDVEYLSLSKRIQLEQRVFHALRRLDILQELLEDDEVTEILVNGPKNIFYEKSGRFYQLEHSFASEEKLQDLIQQMVSRHNRVVNLTTPIVDTRLEDGSRVNIVLHPIAIEGSAISIRKFGKKPLDMDMLIEKETLSREVADFLRELIEARYNIFISGGTSSGKTTLLNALSAYIPQEERVITIEDSAELQLQGLENVVRLETRNSNIEGMKAITPRELIHTALRMRPDRIIVGECRGGEALDMLQAMNTGHDGSLSTGHGNSAEDMLSRLEMMVLMGTELPLLAIRRQIAMGINILVHLERGADKKRRIMEIREITGVVDGEIQSHILYMWDNELQKKEPLYNQKKLQQFGRRE